MKDIFVMQKSLMAQIINGLKSLNLNNYDDYCKIVGIVTLLEQSMVAPPPEEESKPEDVIING